MPHELTSILRVLFQGAPRGALCRFALHVTGERIPQVRYRTVEEVARGQRSRVPFLERNSVVPSMLLLNVNPLREKRAEKAHFACTLVLPLDLDGGRVDVREQRERLCRLQECGGVTPVLVVRSGTLGHLRVYYKLREPRVWDDPEVEILSRRLQRHFGTLKREPVTVAYRLPYSFNWKTGAPVRVELACFKPEATVSLAEMTAALDAVGAESCAPTAGRFGRSERASRPTRDAPAGDPSQVQRPCAGTFTLVSGGYGTLQVSQNVVERLVRMLPPKARELVERGPSSDRSGADRFVIGRLIERGATVEEVHAVYRAHVDGIGRKFAESGRGREYLDDQIDYVWGKIVSDALISRVQYNSPGTGIIVDLEMESGPLGGRRLRAAIRHPVVWPWALRAAGLDPSPPYLDRESVRALSGRRVRVRLEEREGKHVVAAWIPARVPVR